MKTLLFPHSFQRIGWIIFALGIALGAYAVFEGFNGSYTMNNITIISIIVGGVLATCSCEKIEDEMTQQLRLNALLFNDFATNSLPLCFHNQRSLLFL